MKRVTLALALALLPATARAEEPVALDAELGAEVMGRYLSYHQDLFHRLNTYDLTAAPGAYGRAAFYPGALLGHRFASMVGVTLGADIVSAPASLDTRGAPVRVRAWGYTAGLRVRLPAGMPDVGLDLAYVAQRFTLGESTPTLDAGIPNVGAQSLRVGVSARVAITDRVAVSARGAFLAVLDTGVAPSLYFPRLSTNAVEFGAGVAVGLWRGVEVRAGVEYRRYFSSMNPEPGDAYVVGGSVDQYITGTLGVGYRR